MSKKILIIVDDYMPHSIKVAAKMMHELACEFISQGHEVTVLTPNPNQKENFLLTKVDNVNIVSFKSGQIKNVSKVKRAINELLLSFFAWIYCKKYLKQNHHDFIIYYSPSIFFGILVKKLKNIWEARSYLVLRDFFPQWTIDNGLLKENSYIAKFFKFFEKINCDVADIIGVMSQKNLEWFKGYYIANKRIEVLYNWADVREEKCIKNVYREKLNLNDKIVYFYGGNLGHAQDMMNIVRLATNMQNIIEAHFILVGAGDEYELIANSIVDNHLNNITLLPAVNQNDYKQMLCEFDIGLFTLNKNHKTHNFPGKLLGYMIHKMPILGSVNEGNDLKEIVENANAGLISINGEDELLTENAKKLLDNIYRSKMGENANKLLHNSFSVYSATEQILHSLSRHEI